MGSKTQSVMQKEHPLHCNCVECAGKNELSGQEKPEIHIVADGSCPYRINAHTHSLWEKYKHLDIQMCLNIPSGFLNSMIESVVARIAAGERFTPQKKYAGIIPVFDVLFEFGYDGERLVLRMVLPDESGAFKGKLKEQFRGTLALDTIHRAIIRMLYGGEKSTEYMNKAAGKSLSYDLAQLAFAGLIEMSGDSEVFFITESGVRLYKHLNPDKQNT